MKGIAVSLATALTLYLPLANLANAQSLPGFEPSNRTQNPDSAAAVADMDLEELAGVRVSPFEVSTRLDRGYRASNSVSGSHFDCPIRDLPMAIQAFTKSFIEDQKPVNVFDVARYSPGVTYRSNDFNEGNANLAIRGFAVSNTKGNIQTLRDGFHGPSIFDFTNISRVEIVKGPASFLYGQVAPGGIVNVITKNPQKEFAAHSALRYGSYGEYRISADVTGPVSPKLFYRFASSYDQDINYWDPYDAHSADVAPSLLWQPTESVRALVKYEHFHKMESPQLMQKPGLGRQAGLVPTPDDPNLVGVDFPGLPDDWNGLSNFDYRRSDTHCLNAWIDYQAGDHWDLRTAFSHLDFEIDAVATGNFGMPNNTTSLQGRRVRGQTYTNRGETFETRALGRYRLGATSLRMLLGVQYIGREFVDWAAQAPNDPALGDDPTASPFPLWDLLDPSTWDRNTTVPRSLLTENGADRKTEYIDRSAYAGATFGFKDDRLLALLGGRLTASRNQTFDKLSSVSAPRLSSDEFTPQYGLLYRLTPEFTLFTSYAESFVPGSPMLVAQDSATKPSEPTTGQGFDIGLKVDLLDKDISGTLTFFNVDNENIVNDLAYTDSTGSVAIFNVQSGKQRSRGLELDVSARILDTWQAYLSYSYMDARIIEFSGRDGAILAEDPALLDEAGRLNYKNVWLLHDAPLQMSAPHLANLWTRYDVAGGRFRGLFLAGGVNYVHDQTLLPDGPESSHQTYTLLNLALGFVWATHGRTFSIDLMGKNLADESYRPSQSTRSRPREVLLSLRARF
ncbi:MAG: TonB-dependent siderophore receptor [Candidatus Krumholzibacteriia bacterium]